MDRTTKPGEDPMIRHLALIAACAATLAGPARSQIAVDVELVLAADSSGSMSRRLRELQRDAFVAAFLDPRLHDTVLGGPRGRIAVTYVEWADSGRQRVVVPWRLLGSASDIESFAVELAATRANLLGSNTAISAALLYAAGQFEANGFLGDRRVIDLSGNGMQNRGAPLAEARQVLNRAGIIVNGLVLPGALPSVDRPYDVRDDTAAVVAFFEAEVRTGPGAFVHRVSGEQDLTAAVLRKLVLEVAGAPGRAGARPVTRMAVLPARARALRGKTAR
jgi:hypothetical protein